VNASGFAGLPKPPKGMPPVMIGGGAKRVLGIAGRDADIVSLNFNNSSGKIGPAGVGSSTAELTSQKIDWIRAGAVDRVDGKTFDDIEIEIGAYFTVVTDERDTTLGQMAPMFALEPDQRAEHPHALIGSVDEICDLLLERRETYGISYVTFGASTAEAVAPIVDRLAGT